MGLTELLSRAKIRARTKAGGSSPFRYITINSGVPSSSALLSLYGRLGFFREMMMQGDRR